MCVGDCNDVPVCIGARGQRGQGLHPRVAEAADLQHGKLAQHHVRGVHRHRGPRGLLRGLSGDQARQGLYRRGQERIGVARSEKVTVMTMRRR